LLPARLAMKLPVLNQTTQLFPVMLAIPLALTIVVPRRKLQPVERERLYQRLDRHCKLRR
jgi:hypothetical protein